MEISAFDYTAEWREQTHRKYDSALWYLVPFERVYIIIRSHIHRKIHTPHALHLFELSSYLRRDRLCPWYLRDVEVRAERPGEGFRCDELLVQVPYETVSYSMRLSFEFNADGNKIRG